MNGDVVRVEKLFFAYEEKEILEGLTFSMKPGEIVSLLGPSGAGKSTTTRILTGLLRPQKGRALVFGQSPHEQGGAFYRRIGIADEVPRLFTRLTGRENLQMAADLQGCQAHLEGALESVGLLEAADQKVMHYSKGMRQRLEVIRAFLHNPELVFLDEPTSGLDPEIKRRVMSFIDEKRKSGVTILLSTHDLFVAETLADRVALLKEGRLCAFERPAVLKREAGSRRLAVSVRGKEAVEEHTFDLRGLASNPAFLSCLEKDILSMHTEEPTLEEVFLAMAEKEGRGK